MKQSSMFADGQDSPLFSGTPAQAFVEAFIPAPSAPQSKLYACPICYDTGKVKLQGRLYPCTCSPVDITQEIKTPEYRNVIVKWRRTNEYSWYHLSPVKLWWSRQNFATIEETMADLERWMEAQL